MTGNLQAEIERITNLVAHYLIIGGKAGHYLRQEVSLAELKRIYDVTTAERMDPNISALWIPPADDEQKRKEYFEKCDEVCDMTPQTPYDHARMIHASWAALQVIADQDQAKLPFDAQGKVMRAANEIQMKELHKLDGPTSRKPNGLGPVLSQHPSTFVSNQQDQDDIYHEKFRFRDDSDGGKIKEWTVIDQGTSRNMGDYFLVAFEEDNEVREMQITAKEMQEVLATRVA